MTVYRLARSTYKDDIHGEGASLYGGRWNEVGQAMLYTAQHISLAVLELLVNYRTSKGLEASFHLLEIQFPENEMYSIASSRLKKNWFLDVGYTQYIGGEFLKENRHLALQVPSAVVPEENNVLINPAYNGFSKIKVVRSVQYDFDKRLIAH